jgi:acyl-CoA dehydrogenase
MRELDLLVNTAQRFLAVKSPLSRVLKRLTGETAPAVDRSLWREEAELGWFGLIIPADLGGSELGFEALGRLLECCARNLLPDPILSTICLGTPLLVSAQGRGSERLVDILSGSSVIAVAQPEDRYLSTGTSPVRARVQTNGHWLLSGEIALVLDLPDADWVLIPASTHDGLAWFVVQSSLIGRQGEGVTIDGRRAGHLVMSSVEVDRNAVLVAPQLSAGYETILTQSATLIASWQLGIVEHVFAFTLEHLRNRVQFGVPIGSFQALQHRMAALHCDIAVARSVVESALRALDLNQTDARLLASAAKARTGELAVRVAGHGIQLHGGMGMTEEAGIGVFYKAARMADWLGGTHALHLARAGALCGIEPTTAEDTCTTF